jgi:hypothetical protein
MYDLLDKSGCGEIGMPGSREAGKIQKKDRQLSNYFLIYRLPVFPANSTDFPFSANSCTISFTVAFWKFK